MEEGQLQFFLDRHLWAGKQGEGGYIAPTGVYRKFADLPDNDWGTPEVPSGK
jgi:hypothetical protein